MSSFSEDELVKKLLFLEKGINENSISRKFKQFGESGCRKLEDYALKLNSDFIKQSGYSSITIDADSTVKSVNGNQEGAEKGYNTVKRGFNSYHPILLFCSELKSLMHSWFRTGSTYTSNGIEDMLKQVVKRLPRSVKKVFFRADSGFFSGILFDELEELKWSYLVKVKLKNLNILMVNADWQQNKLNPKISTCEFEYQCSGWKTSRKLKAVRFFKGYEHELNNQPLGLLPIPVYDYFCYCSNLDFSALELHKLYGKRAESENWIAQVKNQLFAGNTLTNDFWANDLFWQLAVMAYNISVMSRFSDEKFHKLEHSTFLNFFIKVPAKVVSKSRNWIVKMYKNYFYKDRWLKLESCMCG